MQPAVYGPPIILADTDIHKDANKFSPFTPLPLHFDGAYYGEVSNYSLLA
jgi:hypothetical protein